MFGKGAFFQYCISDTVESNGNSCKLFVEFKQDSIEDYVQLRIFSTYSGNKNPDEQNTRFKTTLKKESLNRLSQYITQFFIAIQKW